MANNEKIENILNLALEVPLEERMKSVSLETGYDDQDNTWELILKYEGNEDALRAAFPDALIIFLSNGYAVVTIPQEQIEALAAFPMVEYIEKPKRLYFAMEEGRRASCINQVQQRVDRTPGNAPQTGIPSLGIPQVGGTQAEGLQLTGRGVLVACIDSGIDYAHPDFRNADGTTRIQWLWDQTLGQEYSQIQINEALAQETQSEQYALVASRDISGHGTHVAGIAAGNGRASNGRIRGVAYESQLIVVKLGSQQENAFPKTTQLMEAIEYSINKAREANQPVALNISFGNNYGSHTGNSLIETYIDSMATQWKNNIAIGTGNEGASRVNAGGKLIAEDLQNESNLIADRVSGRNIHRIQWIIGEFETGVNLQLWKRYEDEIQITLTTPGGQQLGPFMEGNGTY